MKTRALVMLVAVLAVAAIAMPSYSVCGTYQASGYYINNVDSPCKIGATYCGGTEWHWHLVWPYYSGHSYSQHKAMGALMNGSAWGPNYFSPNKSGAFGIYCMDASNACNRCMHGNNCGASGLTAYICG